MAPISESSMGDPFGFIAVFIFLFFFGVLLLNILLAIVTEMWDGFMREDLWNCHIDKVLREHVTERHMVPISRKISTCSRKRKNGENICCYT